MVLLSVVGVMGDLPVHCLKHDIVGEWVLQIGKVEMTGHGPLACGHGTPDDASTSYEAYKGFKGLKSL